MICAPSLVRKKMPVGFKKKFPSPSEVLTGVISRPIRVLEVC
jgi:hypothetical protein